MIRSRFRTFLYLAVVFASGVLFGAMSHRLYDTNTVNANSTPPPRMDDVRRNYLSEMKRRVGVDDAQIAAINQILDQTKRRFDEFHRQEKPALDKIHQDQVDAVRAILNDQQKIAYENWRAERARRHAEQAKKQSQQQAKK
jgi:hypothetical protein